jgi:hypothetical protein
MNVVPLQAKKNRNFNFLPYQHGIGSATYHHHHHHLAVKELGLLARSLLIHPKFPLCSVLK